MMESADQFKKWRKLKSLELPENLRKSLDKCITKANTAQEEWFTMGLALSRLDRQHQLSRKAFETGGAKLISQHKIKTFYGEESGKKWQNIFDWLSQVSKRLYH